MRRDWKYFGLADKGGNRVDVDADYSSAEGHGLYKQGATAAEGVKNQVLWFREIFN